MPTDNLIIPDEYQDRLRYWADKLKQGYFDIGDITAELIAMCAGSGMGVTDQAVFAAVGRFCDRAPRTVRYYYETAIYFGVRVREEFDMLKFSHFVFARSLGDRAIQVLNYAAERPFVTVEELRLVFCTADQPDAVAETVCDDTSQAPINRLNFADNLVATPTATAVRLPAIYDTARAASLLRSAADTIDRAVVALAMPVDLKSDLINAALVLRRAVPVIARSGV